MENEIMWNGLAEEYGNRRTADYIHMGLVVNWTKICNGESNVFVRTKKFPNSPVKDIVQAVIYVVAVFDLTCEDFEAAHKAFQRQ